MIQEVPPIDPEKIIISLEKKTILKFYIRLYFLFIHNFRKLIEKTNSSGSQGFSKQQKKSILEQYFDEDINNINRLSNSADMFFIKPYFEHLCNNSYDDDCNDYKKFFNKMINYEDDPDKITKDVINQLKSYVNKFNSLSLTEEKIEKIRKLLNKNDGKKLSPGDIQNILSTDDSNQNPESLDTDDTSRTGTGTETETETEDKTMSKSDWLKDTRYESSNTPSFSYQQSFDNIPDNIKILNQNAHIANHLAVEAHTKLIGYNDAEIKAINDYATSANQLAIDAHVKLIDYKTEQIKDISRSATNAKQLAVEAERLLDGFCLKQNQFPTGDTGFYNIYKEYFILHNRKREDDLRSIKHIAFKRFWRAMGMDHVTVNGIAYTYNEPANNKNLNLVKIKLKNKIAPKILYYTDTHFILASYKKNSSGYHFIDYSENPKNYVIIERNQFPDNKRKTPNVKADESAEKIKEYAKSANTYADSGETKLNDARQTQVIKDDATEAKNNADSGETKLNDARQTQVKEDANSAKTYADNGAGKIAEFIIHANNDKFNSTHGKYKEIYNKYIQYILGGQNATQPDLLNYSYKFISNTTTVGYLIQNNNDIRETGVMGALNNLTTIDITGNSDILNVIYRTDDGIIVKGYKESGALLGFGGNIKYINDHNFGNSDHFLMIILKENLIENSRAADAAAQAAQEAEDAKKMLDKVATIQLKSHADKADKAAEDAKKMLGTIQLPNAPPLPPPRRPREAWVDEGQLKDW